MDLQPPSDAMIRDGFHRQVGQYGHELSSFVSAELGGPPSGLSITLETIEWPESVSGSPANWVWFVGSADLAVERAVLRFFQTDVGKRALSADGVEFKLGSAPLRLPSDSANNCLCPAEFIPATAPLQDGQEVVIVFQPASLTRSHICIPATTGGWLQVSPHTHLEQITAVKPRDQRAEADPRYLGGWVVDPNGSTVHGHVAAIVGNRGYLVAPLGWRTA